MKNNYLILICALLISSLSFTATSQVVIPKGKVLLLEFSNASAKFTVPEGKAWYVINVFAAPGKTSINVFLKSINAKDLSTSRLSSTNLFLFKSNEKVTFSFPLAFPSNTTFELSIVSFDLLSSDIDEKTAYINIIEADN
jgi:hypothetical protein